MSPKRPESLHSKRALHRPLLPQALDYILNTDNALPDVLLLDVFHGPHEMTGLEARAPSRRSNLPTLNPTLTKLQPQEDLRLLLHLPLHHALLLNPLACPWRRGYAPL